MTDYIKGLDVSIIQGNIDFNAVKQAGIQFVMLRCYVGNSGKDRDYDMYLQKATNAGLYIGSYNFPFPLPGTGTRTPQWQAETHFNACKTPVAACDAEWPAPEQWSRWGCSKQQINDWCLAYLERYTQLAGRRPLVYTYPYWSQAVDFTPEWGDYDLWIASYQPNAPYIPKPWLNKGWTMWQNSSGPYHLPISGVPVDTDVVKSLDIFTNSASVIPQPAPVPIPTPPVITQPPIPAPPPPPVPPFPPINVNPLVSVFNNIVNWFRKF